MLWLAYRFHFVFLRLAMCHRDVRTQMVSIFQAMYLWIRCTNWIERNNDRFRCRQKPNIKVTDSWLKLVSASSIIALPFATFCYGVVSVPVVVTDGTIQIINNNNMLSAFNWRERGRGRGREGVGERETEYISKSHFATIPIPLRKATKEIECEISRFALFWGNDVFVLLWLVVRFYALPTAAHVCFFQHLIVVYCVHWKLSQKKSRSNLVEME